MRINSMFVANSAEHREGLLYVLGAFPEFWSLPSVPADFALTLVVIVEGSHDGGGQEVPLQLFLESPDGSEAPLVEFVVLFRTPEQYVAGAPAYAQAIIPLQMHIAQVGTSTFIVRSAGEDLASMRLAFRLAPSS